MSRFTRSMRHHSELDWVRPTCPTCHGTRRLPLYTGIVKGSWPLCPENDGRCDGFASLQRMARVFEAVFNDLNVSGERTLDADWLRSLH